MKGAAAFSCVLLLLFTMIITGCTGADDEPTGGHGHDVAPARVITVASRDSLRFEPEVIRAAPGERVRIILDNTRSSSLHDFTIAKIAADSVESVGAGHDHGGARVHVAAAGGAKGELAFTPTEAGAYTFYCSVPGHADAGMRGTLVVEGSGPG